MEIEKINDALIKSGHNFKVVESWSVGIYLTDQISPRNRRYTLLLVSESVINNLLDIMAGDMSEEEAENLSPESLDWYYKQIDMFDGKETWALFFNDPR